MRATRRRMIVAMTSAVAVVFADQPLHSLQVRGKTASPQPMPSPNAPKDENVPAGLDGANIPWRSGQRATPPATWLEIKTDAQKLLKMATDFNTRVDHTNMGAMMPLALMKEAHQIEKLAKKIQRRMKG